MVWMIMMIMEKALKDHFFKDVFEWLNSVLWVPNPQIHKPNTVHIGNQISPAGRWEAHEKKLGGLKMVEPVEATTSGYYRKVYIHIIWVNYNDLTATSL